jgi:glycosyl transferase family 25
MVCEDDCEFLATREEIDDLVNEFASNSRLDVLCLAFNTRNPKKVTQISKGLSITSDTQTTACYILKPHMVEKLAWAAYSSIEGLTRTLDPTAHAIDIEWKSLQKRNIFAIPNIRIAKQLESYSDIEGKLTNYGV